MRRSELVESRAGEPGAASMFGGLTIVATLRGVDVFDTRVFRGGARVDGDPFPFKAWLKPGISLGAADAKTIVAYLECACPA